MIIEEIAGLIRVLQQYDHLILHRPVDLFHQALLRYHMERHLFPTLMLLRLLKEKTRV